MEEAELRYELKLICERPWLAQARSWIRMHPEGFVVAYPPRQVNSLYLDTMDMNGFNDNLAGVLERQKLRLRWYGTEMRVVQPRLELKEKYNMVGRKRVYPLPCTLDLTQPWKVTLETILDHTPPLWQHLLRTVNRPTLLNRYRREYYVTPDRAVRATLDFQQIGYDQRLTPRINLRYPLAMPDNVVIEVKAAQEESKRLEAIVAYFPIPRSRNSKYANGLLSAIG